MNPSSNDHTPPDIDPPLVPLGTLTFGDSFCINDALLVLIREDRRKGRSLIARIICHGKDTPGVSDSYFGFAPEQLVRFVPRTKPEWARARPAGAPVEGLAVPRRRVKRSNAE